MVCITSPDATAADSLTEDFLRVLPESVRRISLGGTGDPPLSDVLDELTDELSLGPTPVEPTLVVARFHGGRAKGLGRVLSLSPDLLIHGDCRVIVTLSSLPDSIRHSRVLHIDAGYAHPRPALIAQISHWVADRSAPGTMIVLGAPGVGKSYLLQEAARELDAVESCHVAHSSIRTWSLGEPVPASAAKIAGDLAAALHAEGFDYPDALPVAARAPAPVQSVTIEQKVDTVFGTVIGMQVLQPDHAADAIQSIVSALTARRESDRAQNTLVLVIDALDEWETFSLSALPALRGLLTHHRFFGDWNVKFLLSGQYRPDWLPPGAVLDLDRVDTRLEIRSFAETRLRAVVSDDAERAALVERVADLSGGLFLVAAGYLDEIGERELTAADLGDVTMAANAVEYCVEALKRIRQRHFLDRGRDGRWLDAERLLSMLAVLPQGCSAAQIAAAWPDPEVPTGNDWHHVREALADGPVRRYFTSNESGTWFQLPHSAVRAAIAQLEPWDERTGITAERRRWIARHVPAGGAGALWDPVDGRPALAEVGTVLADLLADTVHHAPHGERVRDEARAWTRALLEEWDWLEACIAHADPAASVPLGLGRVLQQIGLMIHADPELASLALWTGPFPQVDPVRKSWPPRVRTTYTPAAKPSTRPPRLARAEDPLIIEILSHNANFPTAQAARARLAHLSRIYITSRYSRILGDPEQVFLFVKGYQVGTQDWVDGRKGRYLRLWAAEDDTGEWTIRAQLHEAQEGDPVGRVRRGGNRLPNWSDQPLTRVIGNPRIKAHGPLYQTRQDAENDLKRLKELYPKAVVLMPGKALVRIYERGHTHPETGRPLVMTSAALLVVVVPGGFHIEARITSRRDIKGAEISEAEFQRLRGDE